jgi:hypothetical protein
MIACKIDADEKVLRLHTSTPLSWRDYFVGIVTTPCSCWETPCNKNKKGCITDSCLLNFGGMEMKWGFHLKELTVRQQRPS